VVPTFFDYLQPDGALVQVHLGLSTVARQALWKQSKAVPPAIQKIGLLDTGAEGTAIDTQAVLSQLQQMGVQRTNFGLTNTPALGGLAGSVSWMIDFVIIPPWQGRARPAFAPLVRRNLPVEDLNIGRLGYDVLIGRDVLNSCRFDFDGFSSAFWLTY